MKQAIKNMFLLLCLFKIYVGLATVDLSRSNVKSSQDKAKL